MKLPSIWLLYQSSFYDLLGVDRFMSEARATTNLIGNGVATIVIAKSENEFDEAKYQQAIKVTSI